MLLWHLSKRSVMYTRDTWPKVLCLYIHAFFSDFYNIILLIWKLSKVAQVHVSLITIHPTTSVTYVDFLLYTQYLLPCDCYNGFTIYCSLSLHQHILSDYILCKCHGTVLHLICSWHKFTLNCCFAKYLHEWFYVWEVLSLVSYTDSKYSSASVPCPVYNHGHVTYEPIESS